MRPRGGRGTDGCRAIFEEILACDFSDAAYFSVHRLTVDTYSLQHPDRYCRSAKSLAAHLCGLCAVVEQGGNRAVGADALRRWLDGRVQLEKPQIPTFRGERTIADVHDAPDPATYPEAVNRWALSTWRAYSPLHELAREWLGRANRRSSAR